MSDYIYIYINKPMHINTHTNMLKIVSSILPLCTIIPNKASLYAGIVDPLRSNLSIPVYKHI